MATDAKYGRITVEREPGNPLGVDEPVFLLRARDVTSGATLAEYRAQSEAYGSPAEHLAALDDVILAFARWQDAHPESVKVPD